MYDFRKMTPAQRAEVLEHRQRRHLPWHSPPHGDPDNTDRYLITAACYEHHCIIGRDPARMSSCEEALLSACRTLGMDIYAWCVLPNHYHVLVKTIRLKEFTRELGRFHGRSSRVWNQEDRCEGRKVWHRCFDRQVRSERHFWASVNYIHHNPIYHGHAEKWQDWPWSSAANFLESVGREEAARIWADYPILDFGKGWDV